jgi:anti-anti-sigma factor
LFRLSGRIDTITSPDLLSVYREADDKSIRTVRMDMTDVSYISSAGLRVLMIMLGDHPDNVKLDNVNEDIMEILRTTGFDSILFGEE